MRLFSASPSHWSLNARFAAVSFRQNQYFGLLFGCETCKGQVFANIRRRRWRHLVWLLFFNYIRLFVPYSEMADCCYNVVHGGDRPLLSYKHQGQFFLRRHSPQSATSWWWVMVCVDWNINCYTISLSIHRCMYWRPFTGLVSQDLCFTHGSVPPRSSLAWLFSYVLRNRFSRLEMDMYLLSVVVASGGFECYCVGDARGAQTRWLTIPRLGHQLVLSWFLLDLARNSFEAYGRNTVGCRRGV